MIRGPGALAPLPESALAVIRYHSFYTWHQEGAHTHLMRRSDRDALSWVRRFNPYDLYSKANAPPDSRALRPYYEQLVAELLPDSMQW